MTIVPLLRRFGLHSFLPLAAAVAVSFLLWPSWPGDVLAGDALSATGRNLSLFPYSIPLGVVALGLAWRSDSLLWGCVASLSFAPYFYVHSTLPLLFLMADRKWWLGVLGTLGSWLFVFLALQGVLTVNF